MPDEKNLEESSYLIIPEHDRMCKRCASHYHGQNNAQSLSLVRIDRKTDKFVAKGNIVMSTCPVCGMAVDAIHRAVPVELSGLVCACGGKEFNISINTLAPSSNRKKTDWEFEIDIFCKKCSMRKFFEKMLSFIRIKRIRVDPIGVDVQLK